MDRKVIGAGMLFVGSGCGPALSKAQQDYLSKVVPGNFYSVDTLLQMLAAAEARDPKLIVATGRRWASALKSEYEKQGITTIIGALRQASETYAHHHQGDMGQILIEETGPTSVILTNTTPYPDLLMTSLCEWFPSGFGADEVETQPTAKPHSFVISWTEE